MCGRCAAGVPNPNPDPDPNPNQVCGRRPGERGVAPARERERAEREGNQRAERPGERRGAGGEAKWEWRRETRDGGRGERRPTVNGRQP